MLSTTVHTQLVCSNYVCYGVDIVTRDAPTTDHLAGILEMGCISRLLDSDVSVRAQAQMRR